MSKVFVVNFDRCNGCHNCQIVCKDEFCDQPWLPYSEAQPLTGQFWMQVKEYVRGQVPWTKISYQPTFCNHCAEAPCIAAGDGAVYRREDGLIVIDPVAAKGKPEIVDACPIGAIFWNAELALAQKCTGCAHLLDNGWNVPRCVDACATDALLYVEESELDLSQAEVLDELQGLGPKVYYYNKPKRFIAGTVVDVAADEVAIGAKVELIDASGAVVAERQTDDFGDFKFDQIAAGAYTVLINGEKRVPADVIQIDLSVGDIDIS